MIGNLGQVQGAIQNGKIVWDNYPVPMNKRERGRVRTDLIAYILKSAQTPSQSIGVAEQDRPAWLVSIDDTYTNRRQRIEEDLITANHNDKNRRTELDEQAEENEKLGAGGGALAGAAIAGTTLAVISGPAGWLALLIVAGSAAVGAGAGLGVSQLVSANERRLEGYASHRLWLAATATRTEDFIRDALSTMKALHPTASPAEKAQMVQLRTTWAGLVQHDFLQGGQ